MANSEITEHYKAMKMNKNEMKGTISWLELKSIISSERSHTQKNTYGMIPFTIKLKPAKLNSNSMAKL